MTDISSRLSRSLEGRYTIERELGQGGMATVYLALDARHERHVAIKVLHPELSAVLGAERFLSEIKLTASLQHPHILPLFDSGVADGLVYYVMPFVEGETLRGKLDRERQLSVGDSIRLATEIADALQYAHERGVVHRDIKPENVLLQNGHAIVADFGIALAVQQAGGTRMTQTGMSLGTPQYMAPEQAMGERNIDARADIYALGAVTYEMLAGEPPFTGPTAQSIVARVMTERARPLRSVRDTVPPQVEFAVATALEKLPADRMRSAQAFADALRATGSFDHAGATHSLPRAANNVRALSYTKALALAAVCLLVGLAVAVPVARRVQATTTESDGSALSVSFEVTPPDSVSLRLICCGQLFAISPNGRYLVYQGSPSTPDFVDSGRVAHQLYLRDLTDLSVRALPGTRDAEDLFFSPDGTEIGFAHINELRKLTLAGSTPQPIATLPAGFNAGGSWGADGIIYFGVSNRMMRYAANGGTADTLFTIDSPDLQVFGPQVIDDPHVLLYTMAKLGERPRTMWRSLADGAEHFVTYGATPTYVAAKRALLVVRNDGTLVQYPFDIVKGDTTGPGTRIASRVVLRSPIEAHAEYSASATGTVVLANRRENESQGGISFVDLRGATPKVSRLLQGQLRFYEPHFSPDSRSLAVAALGNPSTPQVMILDLTRGAVTTLRLPGISGSVNYSASNDSIVYRAGAGDIYMAATDGSGEPQRVVQRTDWSPNDFPFSQWGPWFAVAGTQGKADGRADILVANRDSGGRASVYAGSKQTETLPAISPDGQWLVYISDESGKNSAYVSAFPHPGGRYVVSPTGADVAQWSADSHAIYFSIGNRVYSAAFTPGPAGAAPIFGEPRLMYSRDPWGAIGIAPDGKSIAFVDRVREGDPKSLVVKLNAVVNFPTRCRFALPSHNNTDICTPPL